ncbi:Hypothetical protein NTJ_05550 [Nesidiocoris tenuis]|uniref:Uncharacterized protein n=1 Tax=Nesidiocoris tenuis TaxID=355587 RepID=A0ABN7AKG9_9HEMI|nr:Hypothetical protein NTJ_05550 [Nesidiocoris tenuis]
MENIANRWSFDSSLFGLHPITALGVTECERTELEVDWLGSNCKEAQLHRQWLPEVEELRLSVPSLGRPLGGQRPQLRQQPAARPHRQGQDRASHFNNDQSPSFLDDGGVHGVELKIAKKNLET